MGTDDAAMPRKICVRIMGHNVAPSDRGTRAVPTAGCTWQGEELHGQERRVKERVWERMV